MDENRFLSLPPSLVFPPSWSAAASHPTFIYIFSQDTFVFVTLPVITLLGIRSDKFFSKACVFQLKCLNSSVQLVCFIASNFQPFFPQILFAILLKSLIGIWVVRILPVLVSFGSLQKSAGFRQVLFLVFRTPHLQRDWSSVVNKDLDNTKWPASINCMSRVLTKVAERRACP